MLSDGAAQGENVISELDADEAGVDKVGQLQHGVTDAESLSSGSSIELLDISEEGHDHTAAKTPVDEKDSDEKLVEAVRDGDTEDEEKMSGGGDGEKVVISSSTDQSASTVGSESLIGEEIQTTVAELDVNSASDTVAVMPSETSKQSVNEEDGEDDQEQVAETGRRGECSQSVQEVEMQQSTVMPSSTERTVASELQHNLLSDVTRSDSFTL